MRKVISQLLIPLLLLAASLSSLIYRPGGNIYWPAAGLWALALATLAPQQLRAMPFEAAAAALALLAPNVPSSYAPDVQFIMLPVVAFLLSYITLSIRDIGAHDLLPLLSALLANAFIGLSALAFYYIDQMTGTTFIPTNEAFMLHLISGLIGIEAMALLFYLAPYGGRVEGGRT